MADSTVTIAPITSDDLPSVAEFLEAHMTSGVTAETWENSLNPPWSFTQPNHGFLLRAQGNVVGAYIAFYSERTIDERQERFCNLAAWCVLEEHRGHSLRLLRKLLAQRGYNFTDLSPTGNVIALNARLNFVKIDTTTAIVANIPWPPAPATTRVITDPAEFQPLLSDSDQTIYNDHRDALAVQHVVITLGQRACYILYRRDRRKRLRLFASVLYVGDHEVFNQTQRYFYRHLLFRRAIPFTLVELRVAGQRPRASILRAGRTRMVRTENLQASQIDYLYSELTCVPW